MKKIFAGLSLLVALTFLTPIADAGAQEKKNEEDRSSIAQGQNQLPNPRRHGGRRRRELRRRLAEMDKNHDRQISRDEWTRRPQVFDLIDTNRDGFLTREELKAARDRRHRGPDGSNQINKPPR
ncbi:MAG: hypothetical protein AB1631_04080 [Acidobacteriota bacterium]